MSTFSHELASVLLDELRAAPLPRRVVSSAPVLAAFTLLTVLPAAVHISCSHASSAICHTSRLVLRSFGPIILKRLVSWTSGAMPLPSTNITTYFLHVSWTSGAASFSRVVTFVSIALTQFSET